MLDSKLDPRLAALSPDDFQKVMMHPEIAKLSPGSRRRLQFGYDAHQAEKNNSPFCFVFRSPMFKPHSFDF